MAWNYQNPVWPGYFADPFVLQWRGEYFAYGTGEALERSQAGSVHAFKILHSRDLAHWELIGSALMVSEEKRTWCYWAPEVAAHEGRFFLYYSAAPAGADEMHRLHVAVASHPAGPFIECGTVFPESVGFCIDAHPFRDPRDGTWYLYFARDLFDERTGTALAVSRLNLDMLRGVDAPQTVLRAHADWQIYERKRSHYGQTWEAWHTLEGPCVLEHDSRYYCLYSGGNWQTDSYGVSYAMADHPLGPWHHAAGSEPRILRQRAGIVCGPGHNSHTFAPDGVGEFLVYHAWDPGRTARRMCIDPLVWTPDGPRCPGPTTDVQYVS